MLHAFLPCLVTDAFTTNEALQRLPENLSEAKSKVTMLGRRQIQATLLQILLCLPPLLNLLFVIAKEVLSPNTCGTVQSFLTV